MSPSQNRLMSSFNIELNYVGAELIDKQIIANTNTQLQ